MNTTNGFMMSTPLLMTSLILVLGAISFSASHVVRIAVLLPFDETRLFSVKRARPAIEYAISYLQNETDIVNNISFYVTYRDTNCTAGTGMNAAVRDVYEHKSPLHAFLGPVCDYTVAPVARQVVFWNIPLISVGALASDFTNNHQTEYRLLTRVGPIKLDSFIDSYKSLFQSYGWKRSKIIYDKEGQSDKMDGFCHLTAASLHYATKQDYYKIMGDYESILRKEVGLKNSGMYL